MPIPILPLIVLGGGLLLGSLLGRGGRGGGGGGNRPTQQLIPLPQPPLREDEVIRNLFLTRDLWNQLRTQGVVDTGADLSRGLLREAQRLVEETAAAQGYSGGMAGRILADALLGAVPQGIAAGQQAQDLAMRLFQLPLNEAALWAQLTGQIGGRPALPLLQFLAGLQASTAAATGVWNPVFQWGLIPESSIIRHQQFQDLGQLLFQLLLLAGGRLLPRLPGT